MVEVYQYSIELKDKGMGVVLRSDLSLLLGVKKWFWGAGSGQELWINRRSEAANSWALYDQIIRILK